MDGDFETKNLSRLLLFCNDNESYLLKNQKSINFRFIILNLNIILMKIPQLKVKKIFSYHYDLR